jgi:uncharacterized protein
MQKWSRYFVDSEKIGLYEQIFENLTIVDSHAHIGLDADQSRIHAKQMIQKLDECNINQAIVFPFNHPQHNLTFTQPNDVILKASKDFPNRLIPFCRLNPTAKWKPELKRCVELGFKGIKLHPRSQNFDINSAKAMRLYEQALKYDLPLLIHTGFGVNNLAKQLSDVVKRFPKLKIIMGHACFVDMHDCIKLLKGKENIIFEISTIKIFDLYELLKLLPNNQIAFGSDYPYYDPAFSLEMLIDTAIMVGKSPKDIRAILSTNLMRWFK